MMVIYKNNSKNKKDKNSKNSKSETERNYPIRECEEVNRKIIVYFYAYQVKTLNGSPAGSTISYFLELEPVEYPYKSNTKKKKTENQENEGEDKQEVNTEDKEEKEEQTTKTTQILKIYFIKGVRGWFRHAGTELCILYFLEVCHTTDKEKDKHGRGLQSDLLHTSGKCEQLPPMKKVKKEEKEQEPQRILELVNRSMYCELYLWQSRNRGKK